MKIEHKNGLYSGLIGAVIAGMIFLVVHSCLDPFKSKPVYIEHNISMLADSTATSDILEIAKLDVFNKLKSQGVVLTPQEYSSQLGSYYNTLITFLVGLFAIFSILSIVSFRSISRKEIEGVKQTIDEKEENLKASLTRIIKESLSESLTDSISTRELISSIITGIVEDELANSNLEDISNDIRSLNERLDTLTELYDELKTDGILNIEDNGSKRKKPKTTKRAK